MSCNRLIPIFALCAGLLASPAFAACESGLAERLHARLHPERPLDERLAACKAWAAFPGRMVVVLPLPRIAFDSNTRVYDLELLLVQRPDNGNTERDKVIARLFQSAALDEDSIQIQDLRIDTSRYKLDADTRAFGVRVRYRNGARSHAFESETVRLYAPVGNTLREVLKEIELDHDSGDQDVQCVGHVEQLRSMLSTGHSVNKGFADLSLTRTQTRSRMQETEDGQCIQQTLPAKYDAVTLRYDGAQYRIPAGLRAP